MQTPPAFDPAAPTRDVLATRPIERLISPFERFLHVEAASGLFLVVSTAVAMFLANSALAPSYEAFWNQHLRISFGSLGLDYPLWYWVNDGLMTLFFFVIGLEIKREVIDGELSEARKVVLPIASALGGALVPVGIFLLLQPGGDALRAWAVPMATDIAFVVGCLSLLGKRVPRGLKIFMLSLAIVDDILAVLVIAAFYTAEIHLGTLALAILGFGVVVLLNRLGVRTVAAYLLVGAVIWLLTLKSGIHPTVAGVALGLLTPASAFLGDRSFIDVLARATHVVSDAGQGPAVAEDRRGVLRTVRFAATEATSPLERLQTGLHPWVGFFIMPVFALANAAVVISVEMVTKPLALAVAAGLVLGKPLGIFAFAFVTVKMGLARLPERTNWGVLLAAGCLAGIGFTMSLFVASLGLEGDPLLAAKGGTLLGSGVSLILGMVLLWWLLPKAEAVAEPPPSSPPSAASLT